MFFLNQDEEEEVKATKPSKKAPTTRVGANGNASPAKNKMAGGKVLRNKTRGAANEEITQSTAAKIAEHQRELHERLQTEGMAKYSEGGGGAGGKEGRGWKRFQSYKGEAALPREVENMRVCISLLEPSSGRSPTFLSQIFVDRKAQTIVLPVHGYAVPFHINTVKNVSKNDEGEFTYLRVNFQTPGQLAGKKEDTVSQCVCDPGARSHLLLHSHSKIQMQPSFVH